MATDGNDRIFGDLGNDWAVGGTGRDTLWGGWGNDLLNADDNLNTANGTNSRPDTNPSYEDFAYGGAGLDVLIANTGGDRLVDWSGEFNTFLVPFSPSGVGAISREFSPQLQALLVALGLSDGADPFAGLRHGGDPTRNGEPFGELGLVNSSDAAWGAQKGSARDPQTVNGSGSVDVQRSAGTLPISQLTDAPIGSGPLATITEAQLVPYLLEAEALWTRALGANDPRLAAFGDVQLTVGTLNPDQVGETVGPYVTISINAAGRGWYLGLEDAPPMPGTSGIDLLTVVIHELGHVLGFAEDDPSQPVMALGIGAGVRRLPAGLADELRLPAVTSSERSTSLPAPTSSASSMALISLRAAGLIAPTIGLAPYTSVRISSREPLRLHVKRAVGTAPRWRVWSKPPTAQLKRTARPRPSHFRSVF